MGKIFPDTQNFPPSRLKILGKEFTMGENGGNVGKRRTERKSRMAGIAA